jgi:nucleotide-binding universal stress UspA family protein
MRAILASDLSPAAQTSRALVTTLQWPVGSLIEVLHVLPLRRSTFFTPPRQPTLETVATMRQQASAFSDGIAEQLRSPGVRVQGTTRVGDAADEIIRRAAEIQADLIIIGSEADPHVGLGAVVARVVDNASCSVLVARTRTISSLVLADDGSSSADTAFSLVASWPLLSRVPVTVASVVDVRAPVMVGPTSDFSEAVLLVDSARELASQLVRDRVGLLRSKAREVRGVIREGGAADQLLEVARIGHADLIVLGSSRTNGLTRFLVGSVARSILRAFPGSVLVARPSIGTG